MRWRVACATAVAVAVAVLAAAAFAATVTKGPAALYRALLTTSFPDSQLPSGYFSAKVSLSEPSKNAKRYHAVGEVEVDVDGPDPNDAIVYYVFRNPTNAWGDFTHPTATAGTKTKLIGRVPGYKLPSQWYVGTITGKNAFGKTVTNGVTAMFVKDKNVIVGGVTTSVDNSDSGNTPAALQLLKSAFKHLVRVGGPRPR
jgi:hypothetical protein